MVSTPNPPPPPDPYATANAQQGVNTNTAVENAWLNNVNQITPYGNITYAQTGNRGGVPQFTATTSLSPELQTLSNTDIANAQQAANTRGALGKTVASTLATPLDLSPNATSAYLDKIGRAEIDPQITQEQTQLNQTLADQGLTPGSEGWGYQQNQFGLGKAQQYNDLYVKGQGLANSALEAQYNEPINALSALQSQSQVSEPGVGTLAPTASSPIAPANLSGDVYSSANDALGVYNGQVSQANALTSGLFGLGGSLIGGLGNYYGGRSSDREDKTDIEPLGRDPQTGLMIHAYRYKGDPKSYPKSVGPMAQNVEKAMPGSTTEVGGHMIIKPGAPFGLGR